MIFFFLTIFALICAAGMGAPVPSTGSHSKRGVTYRGRATYFDTGLGACGHWNTNSQPIIALDAALYNRKACGKWIRIKNTKNRHVANGYIVDECPGCAWGDLDLSPSLFEQLGPMSQGVLPITWTSSGGNVKRSENATAVDDSQDIDMNPPGADFPPELELTEADLKDD